jgi:beta-barrel assembly-enhancing protease
MKARTLFTTCALLALVSSGADAQSLKDRLKKAAAKVTETGQKVTEAGLTVGTVLPIDAEKEIEIGRGIAATVAGRYRVSTDAKLTEYINLVGLVVAAEAPRADIAYRFAVLETSDVNAFAAPGGYIFITKGALNLIENEAELAGVLAHELGHVNRRHVIEQIRKVDVLREVREQSGIEGDKLDKVVGHGANVLFTGLSRSDEAEADSLALQYVSSAGYDTRGFADFITRLGARSSESRLGELLSTHPRPSERMRTITRVMARLNPGGELLAARYRATVRLNAN